MPDLQWNRKWGGMIATFSPDDGERHFGDRWGDPETFVPLIEVRQRFLDPYLTAERRSWKSAAAADGGRSTSRAPGISSSSSTIRSRSPTSASASRTSG